MTAGRRHVSMACAVVLLGALSSVALSSVAMAQPVRAANPRVAVEDTPAGAALAAVERGGPRSALLARVTLPGGPADPQAEARLSALEGRGMGVWLVLPAPAAEADVAAWRRALRALLDRPRTTVAVLEVDLSTQPRQLASFIIQIAATESRVRREGVRVAIGGAAMNDAARRRDVYTSELSPYVDLLAIHSPDDAVVQWLQEIDPLARIAATPPPREANAGPGDGRRLIDSVLQDLGANIVVRAWPAEDFTPAALGALSALAPLLSVRCRCSMPRLST